MIKLLNLYCKCKNSQLDGYAVFSTLVSYFAETLWTNIFRKIDTNNDGTIDENEFKKVCSNEKIYRN